MVILSVLINAFEQVFVYSRNTQLSQIKAVQAHNKFNIFFKTETHKTKRINMYVFDDIFLLNSFQNKNSRLQ